MVYKERYIELIVNNRQIDLEGQDSLNLRLNNVLYSPTEITSQSAEYSFSFDIPATKENNITFGNANILSVANKFVKTYKAKLYADGQLLFDGTMTLNTYKDGMYNVNLVAVKAIDYDDIFGEDTMDMLDWYIPYSGVTSINDYNSRLETDVVFPLVSYGAFQKEPELSDEVGNQYTSKFDLDKYNRWYLESFYPSVKMVSALRRCFEHKGYNVQGDIFNDVFLDNIYQSVNLSDEQDPLYNLGNEWIGSVNLSLTASTTGDGYEQELAFPYYFVGMNGTFGDITETSSEYNYKSVRIYDLLYGNVNINQDKCYLYQPNEHIIVIPADGFYKVEMEVTQLTQPSTSLTVSHWILPENVSHGLNEQSITIQSDLRENTPFEIHLVRNYDDDIELIKGKHNTQYYNGNPNDAVSHGRTNKIEWLTCYPHEDPYNAALPTKQNDLTFRNTKTRYGGARYNYDGEATSEGGSRSGSGSGSGGFGGRRTAPQKTREYSANMMGFVYHNDNTDIMAFDPAINPHFIAGFTTMHGGTPAIIKNGRSWSVNCADENSSFYNQSGYDKLTYVNNVETLAPSEKNANTYLDAPSNSFTSNATSASGKLTTMVWLNKNDIIQLYGVQRAYNTLYGVSVNYQTNVRLNLKISAATPKKYEIVKMSGFGYNSESQFDKDLRLGNFFNSETKMSEWVQGIINAFNFEITQDGNNIFINKKMKFGENNTSIVKLDNKADSRDAEISRIDYPSVMAVRYSIDIDEFGFEKSVPQDKIDLDDWYNYGDSGYSSIQMSLQEGAKENNLDIPFSYCWYVPFYHYNVTSGDVQSGSATPLRLPCISKSEYMMDGYDYTESLKHDGYGLKQRFWFKPNQNPAIVWTDTYPAEAVTLYTPTNLYTNYRDVYFNLSYKINEQSILTNWFNITPYLSSNYVKIDVYLTAEEYSLLKNGARCLFDDDIYYVTELSGYDPSGSNKTTITMIKKV